MLELIAIANADYYEVPFDFIKTEEYNNRVTFLMYFYILNETTNTVYVYTQRDIEENFIAKGIYVKGIKRRRNHMAGYNENITFITKYNFRFELTECRFVMGKNVDYVMPLCYKGIKVGPSYRWYFDSLVDRWGIDYRKFLDKKNYDISEDNMSITLREIVEINQAIAKRTCYKDIIQHINEYIKNNYITLLSGVFSHTDLKELDLRDLKVGYLFNFNGICSQCSYLENVYLCEISLNKPILLKDMFARSPKLRYIDMTKLKGDYPKDNWDIDRFSLHNTLDLGFHFANGVYALE